MLNRDVFATPPTDYHLANNGVAQIQFPPDHRQLEVLAEELRTFVCDGHYAEGLDRILGAFLGAQGKGGHIPAVWISGFYGSGKSHLAKMLAALWVNQPFPEGVSAKGLVPALPSDVEAHLKELDTAATRSGGMLAAGGTMEGGDPVAVTLGFLLRAVDLPTDLRAAQVALWMAELGILEDVRGRLGADFRDDIKQFILSPRLADAILATRPDLAVDSRSLRSDLKEQFGKEPIADINLLESMGRKALMLGRDALPYTLVVLDEVQQFIRQDSNLTLRIQNIAECLSSRFDGRVLLVATGQAALSDVPDLQKLFGRFTVQIALSETDIDSVIRKTVLRKKPDAIGDIEAMLSRHSGEVHRHLHGTKLAHGVHDDPDAVLDWPLLPSRRRLWERILRELDRTGQGGTLRGQFGMTLDAAKSHADKPLGHAVPVDFLYTRFETEAYNAGLIPAETRNRIDALRGGNEEDRLKARILMLVYLLGRIRGDVAQHGVRAQAEMLSDLLVSDLAGEPDLRRDLPRLLDDLHEAGAVIEVDGEWRLQTKESADWVEAYRQEERSARNDPSTLSRKRDDLLRSVIDGALGGTVTVQQGQSREPRRVLRLRPDEKAAEEGLVLRVHSGWEESIEQAEQEIKAAPVTDADLHLLIRSARGDDLERALAEWKAAETVVQTRGIPQTEDGREARQAMQGRRDHAEAGARAILQEAVDRAVVMQAGGQVSEGGTLVESVREAASHAAERLYSRFADADQPDWDRAFKRAQKNDPEALKSVGHNGSPETHPVARILIDEFGSGRTGAQLRTKFCNPPYGWSREAVDGMLLALCTAGQVRVIDDNNQPVPRLADLPRNKIGLCTFRSEKTIITGAQKVQVAGLLKEAGVPYQQGQEVAALPELLRTLETRARASGGEAPAPEPDTVPDLTLLKSAGQGNDLMVVLAERVGPLREKLKAWAAAQKLMSERLRAWGTLERLVASAANDLSKDVEAIRTARTLLAEPDPVPPLLAKAADVARKRVNDAHAAWEKAWKTGEERLHNDGTWSKLAPEQKRELRRQVGLLQAAKPKVEEPKDVAEALATCGLEQWDHMAKAVPGRVHEALAEAASLLEPKARPVNLPGGLLKTPDEVDQWLDTVRDRLKDALAEGPVIPRM